MIDRKNTNKILILVFALIVMIASNIKVNAKTTEKYYTYYSNKKVKTARYITKRDNKSLEQVLDYHYNSKGAKTAFNVNNYDNNSKRRLVVMYKYNKNKKVKYRVYYYYDFISKSKTKPTLSKSFAIKYYDKNGRFVRSVYRTKEGAKSAIIMQAKNQVGRKYRSGGTSPSGFDCSGLTSYVYKTTTSKNIGRTSVNQSKKGKYVSVNTKKLQPGDILFWGSKSSPYHVGIYVGNGKYIHASTPRTGVEYNNIKTYKPSFAKRII